MKIREKWARLRAALSSKWTACIGTIAFVILAVFFAYPSMSYRSFFRQSLSFFGISTYSTMWYLIRNAAYLFCIGIGILLTALFLKKAKNEEWRNEIAAINCAWMAFLLEVSLVLGLQWQALDVWMTMNSTVQLFFIVTVVLVAASLLLLTPFRWARWFGYIVTWAFLLLNILGLSLMLKYFALYSDPFPALAAILVVTTSVSVYSLHFVHLSDSFLINHDGKSKGINLTKYFSISSKVIAIIFVFVLVVGSVAFFQPYSEWSINEGKTREFYTGVAFCGNTTEQAKRLIDRVKNFTNVFVVESLPISYDEATLNEICDYTVDSGLNIIVYFSLFNQYWQINWLDSAEARWGDKFLGVYIYDEPGGLQLDLADQIGRPPQGQITTYADATNWFINGFWRYPSRSDMRMLKMRSIKTFVSDYALYWFDYKAGYDVVFTQFGWYHNRQLHIALCRGAATLHNADWGAIITWTYKEQPYIESGEELYTDAVLAYENGASYVLVFNYPYTSNSTYGILEEEHLTAMSDFWNYTKQNPQPNGLPERVAYVLPRDYGYGFRGPEDKIWGRFEADAATNQICLDINNLLVQYGTQLDVIYEDGLIPNNSVTATYDKILLWNQTE